MTRQNRLERLSSGVYNFDAVLDGGFPKKSSIVFAGPPGTGKTILSQQIGFYNATPETPVIFFQTLSESTAKSISFASQFDYFNSEKVGKSVHFVDLGDLLRTEGVQIGIEFIMEHVRKLRPTLVVIDSFKAFEDLADSSEQLRKFTYEVAVQLMAWECTNLLLGEFGQNEIESNPLFSVVDGIVMLSQRKDGGEYQRFLQVVKMRGTAHFRGEHTLLLSERGAEIFAPRVTTLQMSAQKAFHPDQSSMKTGVQALDVLLPTGIPRGSSCLISGMPGTGKSLLSFEFLFRGAREFHEKGVIFLFEEREEKAMLAASKMGWDLESEVANGLIKIVSIPNPTVNVDVHLHLIHETIVKFGAKRVVIDSSSLFLHKIQDLQAVREKIHQLTTIVQNEGAVGFFITDIPTGELHRLSRFSVEETMVDGVIVLSAVEVGLRRQRYVEVYKMRTVNHANGKHVFKIAPGGLTAELRNDEV